MYNCSFEVINYVLNDTMKKVEMKYELFTYTIIIYLMIWMIFRRKLFILATFMSRNCYVCA